jgi:hypothetical protein
MKINKIKCFLAFVLTAFSYSASADGTYWLTHISAPYQVDNGTYPRLENPSDHTGDIYAITIMSNKIKFNGDECNYDVKQTRKFVIDRLLSDEIDYAGGSVKFKSFLKSKLKTNIDKWNVEYSVVQSKKYIDDSKCFLLQNSAIYQSDKELILWDFTFFYRFALGKDFEKALHN